MEKIPEFDSSEQEANYWERESIADHIDEIETAETKPKGLLNHTLSIRVSSEDLKKLQEFGRESGLGTTTMARYLLKQALKQPSAQLAWVALQDEGVQTEVAAMVEEGKIPADGPEPVMYFFSAARLKKIRAEFQLGRLS